MAKRKNDDPITDPDDPNYDATRDPNSPDYRADVVEPPLGEGNPTPPFYGEVDPEKEWHRFVDMAMRGMYPNLRQGIDWAWGRAATDAPDADPTMQYWNDKLIPADMAAVEEEARRMAAADPSSPYKPEGTPEAAEWGGPMTAKLRRT